MKKNELTFVVFILNKYALATGLPIRAIYESFERLGILDDYLLKHYDTLHTLGENYLIEDIRELIAEKSMQK